MRKTILAFPSDYVYGLLEELQAAWCEQLREARRKLTRRLATDNLRKEDLRFLCLAPGPDGAAALRFPNVFDLADLQATISKYACRVNNVPCSAS